MVDFALYWDNETGTGADIRVCCNDIELTQDLAGDLRNATYIILFSDALAPLDAEIPDGSDNRRGYWADAFSQAGETGSLLWLLSREKASDAVLRRAQQYSSSALAQLVDEGVVVSTEVVAEYRNDDELWLLVTHTLKSGESIVIEMGCSCTEVVPVESPPPTPLPALLFDPDRASDALDFADGGATINCTITSWANALTIMSDGSSAERHTGLRGFWVRINSDLVLIGCCVGISNASASLTYPLGLTVNNATIVNDRRFMYGGGYVYTEAVPAFSTAGTLLQFVIDFDHPVLNENFGVLSYPAWVSTGTCDLSSPYVFPVPTEIREFFPALGLDGTNEYVTIFGVYESGLSALPAGALDWSAPDAPIGQYWSAAFLPLDWSRTNSNKTVTHTGGATDWECGFRSQTLPASVYIEFVLGDIATAAGVGIGSRSTPLSAHLGADPGSWSYITFNSYAEIFHGGIGVGVSPVAHAGDVIGIARHESGAMWITINDVPISGDPEALTGASFTEVTGDMAGGTLYNTPGSVTMRVYRSEFTGTVPSWASAPVEL